MIRSQAEQDCIAEHLTTIGAGRTWNAFVQADGATLLDGDWSWGDGVPPGFVGWAAGQPNDMDTFESGEQQCATMTLANGYAWDDAGCTSDVAHRLCQEL